MKKAIIISVILGIIVLLIIGVMMYSSTSNIVQQSSFSSGVSLGNINAKFTIPTSYSVTQTVLTGTGECRNMPGGGQVCCDNDGWVLCDDGSGGYDCHYGSCSNTDNFRCDVPGHVRCGNTNTCGPSHEFCENWLNGDKSCNSDRSRCCNNGGWIIDYSAMLCCPPAVPFYAGANSCVEYPTQNSDNFYTRNSECKAYAVEDPNTHNRQSIYTEEVCSGTTYKKCAIGSVSSNPQFYNKWYINAVTVGKCGIDCLKNSDCPDTGPDSIISINGEKHCNGVVLMQKSERGICNNNKCSTQIFDEILETCDYQCGELCTPDDEVCLDSGVGCISFSCVQNSTMCSSNNQSVLMCDNNSYVTKELCNNGCEAGKCKPDKRIYLYAGIFFFIVAALIFGVIGYKFLFKRK